MIPLCCTARHVLGNSACCTSESVTVIGRSASGDHVLKPDRSLYLRSKRLLCAGDDQLPAAHRRREPPRRQPGPSRQDRGRSERRPDRGQRREPHPELQGRAANRTHPWAIVWHTRLRRDRAHPPAARAVTLSDSSIIDGRTGVNHLKLPGPNWQHRICAVDGCSARRQMRMSGSLPQLRRSTRTDCFLALGESLVGHQVRTPAKRSTMALTLSRAVRKSAIRVSSWPGSPKTVVSLIPACM